MQFPKRIYDNVPFKYMCPYYNGKKTLLRRPILAPQGTSQIFIPDCRIADQIEKNEMGGVCSTYGGEERCIQGFDGEIWWKETVWKS
jgi:hypothetical protein